MPAKTKNELISIRISSEMRSQLQDIADQEGRTLSNLITFILQSYLNNRKDD